MKSLTVGTVALICLALYGVWVILNFFGSKNRRKRQRKADRVKLNKHQKKIYKEAKYLQGQGNIKSAAKMFESLQLTREAISILEKEGLIHEAAAVLLRINRPNRAGIIYGRNRMWKEAAECFKKANLPEQVAVCCKLQGDLATAVVYFEEAKQYLKAAECYEELGKHQKAAQIYAAHKMTDQAIEQYKYLVEKSGNLDSLKLNKDEVKLIIKYLTSESADVRLADILVVKNQIIDVICKLIKSNQYKKARKIYEKCTADLGPELLAYEDFNEKESESLAKIFAKAGAHEYAAMVCERIKHYEKAGDLFHLNEDYERAAYCYERANLKDKVTEMRIEIASRGEQKNNSSSPQYKRVESSNNPFRLEATGSSTNDGPPSFQPNPLAAVSNGYGDTLNEKTSVIAAAPSIMPNRPVIDISLNSDAGWTALNTSKFLEDLSSDQKRLIQSIGEERHFLSGDIILNYNQEAPGIFIILTGQVEVWKILEGSDTKIDAMFPPASLGKLWLLLDKPSQVKFIAGEDDTSLFVIPKDEFISEMDKDGTLARNIYKKLSSNVITKLLSYENKKENLESD